MSDYPVRVKKNRALPLKANVFDAFGFALADTDLTPPPVLQVFFDSADSYADPLDVTDQIQSVGQSDEGNQFRFTDENKWQFNLSIKNYTATGNYIVLLQSGDKSQYEVYPMCVTEFVIE
jgi:hypothetical protein